MDNNKLETISNLFEGSEIRSIWDSEKEDYYFSVVDIISALTESNNPRNYWNTLKRRMTEEEKSELYAKCVQLKMKSQKDGKSYLTDTLDTKGIFRLIESIPSPKAEPFKLWLAQMGGNVAKVARDNLEEKLGKTVITKNNALNYKYLDDNKLDKTKKLKSANNKNLKEKNNTEESNE